MHPGPLVAGMLALLAALAPSNACAASAAKNPAALINAVGSHLDPRVAGAMKQIKGVDRRLLALRSYLRAGTGLPERWSWTAEEIEAFSKSVEYDTLQSQIEDIKQAFAAANPGFELWVNPEVRSLDIQIANWNRNDSVSRASAALLTAFRRWLGTGAVKALPPAELRSAAEKFLMAYTPTPVPTLAAPGLSPHGQMRAIDFQIQRGDTLVAAPRSATIASAWDRAGWTEKLKAAVRAGSDHFSGPLESPREPWHYTYSPAPEAAN
jgi:hypothetical protein